MKNIVLVQPKVGPWEYVRAKPMFPLAFLYISAPLWKEYRIKIIDQRINPAWKDELTNELKKDPLCVGLTSVTGTQLDRKSVV